MIRLDRGKTEETRISKTVCKTILNDRLQNFLLVAT